MMRAARIRFFGDLRKISRRWTTFLLLQLRQKVVQEIRLLVCCNRENKDSTSTSDFVPYRCRHNLQRILCETFLQPAGVRGTNFDDGFIGSRESKNVIPYGVVVTMPFHREALFTTLNMSRKSTVSKPELFDRPVFVDQVDDTRNIERPKAKMARQYADCGVHLNGRVGGQRLNPAEIKLLPTANCCYRSCETQLSSSQLHAIMLEIIALRRGGKSCANLRIRKWQVAVCVDKILNLSRRRFC